MMLLQFILVALCLYAGSHDYQALELLTAIVILVVSVCSVTEEEMA